MVFLSLYLISVSSSSSLVVLNATNYVVQFDHSNPYSSYYVTLPNTTGMSKIMSVFPSFVREIQIPKWILNNVTTLDQASNLIQQYQKIIHTYSFNQTLESEFSTTVINNTEGNYIGVQFNTSLSNGARASFIYSLNPRSASSVPVPRPHDYAACSNPADLFAPKGCKCVENHTIPLNNIKYTALVEDWPFQQVNDSDGGDSDTMISAFAVNLQLTGRFWLPNINVAAPLADLVRFPECDVASLAINFNQGLVKVPINLFSTNLLDGVPRTSRILLSLAGIQFLPTGEAVLNITHVTVGAFNNSFYYDPDFSVLLGQNTIPESQSSTTTADGGTKSVNKGWIIAVAVVLSVVGVFVLIVIAGAFIAVVIYKLYQRNKSPEEGRDNINL